MTTKQYTMPKGQPIIGTAQPNGQIILSKEWAEYLRGLEDVSKRVAADVGAGATTDELRTEMQNAGQMKKS